MARSSRRRLGCEAEEPGLLTAEDHGRGGSHHTEEGRILGALVRRHSCTFLGAMRPRGRRCSSSRRCPHASAWGRLKGGRGLPARGSPVERRKMAKRGESRDRPGRENPSGWSRWTWKVTDASDFKQLIIARTTA